MIRHMNGPYQSRKLDLASETVMTATAYNTLMNADRKRLIRSAIRLRNRNRSMLGNYYLCAHQIGELA